jgi:hypothetical protein
MISPNLRKIGAHKIMFPRTILQITSKELFLIEVNYYHKCKTKFLNNIRRFFKP